MFSQEVPASVERDGSGMQRGLGLAVARNGVSAAGRAHVGRSYALEAVALRRSSLPCPVPGVYSTEHGLQVLSGAPSPSPLAAFSPQTPLDGDGGIHRAEVT